MFRFLIALIVQWTKYNYVFVKIKIKNGHYQILSIKSKSGLIITNK